MELELDIDPAWPAGLDITRTPLQVRAADPDAWLAAITAVTDGPRVIVHPPAELFTDLGWRAALLEATVLDQHGVRLHRLTAVYAVHHLVAAVVVRATPAAWASHRDAVLAMLRAARPALRGDTPVALAELWTDPAP